MWHSFIVLGCCCWIFFVAWHFPLVLFCFVCPSISSTSGSTLEMSNGKYSWRTRRLRASNGIGPWFRRAPPIRWENSTMWSQSSRLRWLWCDHPRFVLVCTAVTWYGISCTKYNTLFWCGPAHSAVYRPRRAVTTTAFPMELGGGGHCFETCPCVLCDTKYSVFAFNLQRTRVGLDWIAELLCQTTISNQCFKQ